MRYGFFLTAACCFLSFPVLAAETVSVLGRDFSVTPFTMEQPSLPWEDVKSCLPAEVAAIPPKPLSDDQILTKLETIQTAAETKYESLLTPAIEAYAKAHPGLTEETVEFRVATDSLKKMEPPTPIYMAACEFLALTYVHDMIYAKTTPPPPAPGEMPSP